MFQNTNIRDKYDDLNILFYKDNTCKKASFLISILYDNLNVIKESRKYTSQDIFYDICNKSLDKRLHKDYYSVQSIDSGYNCPDCPNDKLIHNEIRNFGFIYNACAALFIDYEKNSDHVVHKFYTEAEHATKKQTILNLINDYSGDISHTNTLRYFKQKLINKILILYDSNDNVLTAPSEWSNCSYFMYNVEDINNYVTECQLDYINTNIINPDTQYYSFFNMLFPSLVVIENPNYNPVGYFNYNITSEFLRDLLEKDNKININVSSFFTEEDSISCRYFRMVDQLEKLWMIDDATGKPVDISFKSEYLNNYLKKISTTTLCNDVGYKNSESCTTYLTNCIFKNKENDINKCKEYMLQSNYWSNIKSEIEQLNPELAKITLERFGFKIIEEYDDNANQTLKKFQTYTSWLKNLHTVSRDMTNDLQPEEYEQISNNTQLKGYLDLLVNKINSNPAILNTNYICKTNNNNNYSTNQFNDTRLAAYGIKGINTNRYTNINNIQRINYLVTDKTRYFLNLVDKVLINHPIISNNNNLPYIYNNMYGGSNTSQSILTEFNPSYEIISDIFNGLNNHLKAQNKQITPADLREINNLLENLRKSETKLIKVISYLEKYFDVISLYKNYDSNNVLSIDHIRTFSDKTKNTSQILTNTHDKLFLLLSKIV